MVSECPEEEWPVNRSEEIFITSRDSTAEFSNIRVRNRGFPFRLRKHRTKEQLGTEFFCQDDSFNENSKRMKADCDDAFQKLRPRILF